MSSIDAEAAGEILTRIARLLELKGENPFKVRAYQNAARALEMFTGDLRAVAEAGELEKIEGIGKAIAEKLTELTLTGRLPYYEDLCDEFPPEIFHLFEIGGLGPKKIKALYEKLGVNSLSRLERACKDGRVAALDGFGEKTATKLLEALAYRKSHVGQFRLGDAAVVAEAILERLRELPEAGRVSVAGSYRRRKEVIGDLDFLVASSNPGPVMEAFASDPEVETVLARGETKTSVRLNNGLQCDLRVVKPVEFPFALAYFTGSKEHNVELRSLARKRGWSLNEYRIRSEKADAEAPPKIDTEADLYHAFDLEYIPPELRENRGEFAAAASGKLPKLIELENLRGTFHNHTHASDGRNSLEEMALAAEELGLAYFGFADHSKSSVQANGLSAERLREQIRAIREWNATHEGIHLFAGVECDILRDGSLDFDDELLAELDYVVISVHNALTLGEKEMTDRIIRAMQNPHATMLGHVTGRLLLTREPYKVHLPDIIDAAAETGTIIELNANPRRLDMDWRWWALAKEKGIRSSINPDAHRVEDLEFLWHGITQARKGGLEKSDVINTLPLDQVRKVLSAKRGR